MSNSPAAFQMFMDEMIEVLGIEVATEWMDRCVESGHDPVLLWLEIIKHMYLNPPSQQVINESMEWVKNNYSSNVDFGGLDGA